MLQQTQLSLYYTELYVLFTIIKTTELVIKLGI